MGKATPESLLEEGCRKLGLEISPESGGSLVWYYRELIRWNKKINLIAKAGETEVIEKHFLDSLTLLPLLEDLAPEEKSLLDLGTGAGFPGLVLKTVLPDLKLLLVEPRLKRVAFLRHIIRNLKLEKVETKAARLESTPPAGLENACPLITCRAFASISVFLNLIRAYSPPEGRIICMKGPRADEEIEEWRKKQPDSPFRLDSIHHYRLPFSGAERSLVIFIKQEP